MTGIGYGCLAYLENQHQAAGGQEIITRPMRILAWTLCVSGCLHYLIIFIFTKGAFVFAVIIAVVVGLICMPAFLLLLARSLAKLPTSMLTQSLVKI